MKLSTHTHVVALSGGKDSTAMSFRLEEIYPDTGFVFVYTPTGDELPEMEEHWRFLEKSLRGPLVRINSTNLVDLIYQERMIPNFRARFCTRVLKIEPYLEFMYSLPVGSISYVGLRGDEEDRLGIINPKSNFTVRYPMQEWGWKLSEVKDYLRSKNINIPKRTDCGACFFQRLQEWKDLWLQHPERYEQYVQIESNIGHTFRSPGRDTWPADLYSLRQEFIRGRILRKTRKVESGRCRFCSM